MKKKQIVSYLVFILMFFTSFNSFSLVTNISSADNNPSGGIIDGDMVYWENDYARLEVTPHTSNNIITQTQYADITWKYPDNNIDIAFCFDEPLFNKKDIWLWQNISHDVIVNDYGDKAYNFTLENISNFQTLSEQTYVDLGDNSSLNYAQGNASYHGGIGIGWVYDFIILGYDSFEWLNPEHTSANFTYHSYGITGNHIEQENWFDWAKKTSLFQHTTYNNKEYYYLTNIPVKQDKTYTVKWQYDIPIHSSGKWELMAKLSSETISEALISGHYVMIDPWWNSDWDYSKLITIDPSKVSGSSDLTNFPILVHINGDADIGGECQADIEDIRFVNIDNSTEYNFEIENYTIVNGELFANIWVNLTTLSYNTDMRFWIFYGNDAVGSGEDAVNVWDSNYLGVYHLNESTGTTCVDSTSYGNDGTYIDSLPTQTSCGGRYGQTFDGAGDYIDFSSKSSTLVFSSLGTIEYSMDAVSEATLRYLLFYSKDGDNTASMFLNDVDAFSSIGTYSDVVEWNSGAQTFSVNQIYYWHVFDTDDIKATYNANTIFTDTATTTPLPSFEASASLYVGKHGTVSGREYDGTLRELRFSNIRRTDDWLTTCYETSENASTFLSFGSEQIKNTAPTFSGSSPTSGTYNQSFNPTINITINDADGDDTTVDFYISTDNNSWTHVQTNTSHTANTSASCVLTTANEYQTTYYWNVTANDTEDNSTSTVYNFETTPYRTLFFNDTFPNENWVADSINMTHESGWENFTYAAAGYAVGTTMSAATYNINLDMYDVTYDIGPSPRCVFTDVDTGYCVGIDTSGTDEPHLYKTTDGGEVWADIGGIDTASDPTDGWAGAVWYDQWTPGDTSGTKIYLAMNGDDYDEVEFNYIDTSGDTYRGSWVMAHDMGVADGSDGSPAICKGTDGILWLAGFGNTPGLVNSSDGGDTWISSKPATLFDDDNDDCQLLPLPDGDIMCIYFDHTAVDLGYFIYTKSTNSWSGWTKIDDGDIGTYCGWSASMSYTTGDIYVVINVDAIAATGDIQFWMYSIGNSTWWGDINLEADAYGYNAAISVHKTNDDIYVWYGDGALANMDIYYQKSTNGGNTWSAREKINTVTDDNRFCIGSFMSNDRIYATWLNDDINDWHGNTLATYSSSSANTEAHISSVEIYKPSGYTWDKFYATVNDTTHCSFALSDNSTDYNISSSLTGNGDDISSLTNNSLYIFGNFSSSSVNMASWNITWASAANNPPTITNPYPANQSIDIELTPTLNITINDADGNLMNITWYSNSSGSWKMFGTGGALPQANYSYGFEDESDFDNWTTTGKSYNSATFAHTGTYSLEIEGASEYACHNLSLASYSKVNISWWDYPHCLETGEYLYLRFYDGTSWHTIQTVEGWQVGIENTHTQYYNEIDTNTYTFNDNCKICWNISASDAADNYYLDDIDITYGYIGSMKNGTYADYTSNFSIYNTTYYWNVSVNDGTDTTNSDVFHFTTLQDPSPPSITINFAGNLSDSGGPYWRSPGETTQLTGVWSDGYYANDSHQQEDWIYINISSSETHGSVVTNIWLQWLNETTWTNYTYAFVNTAGDYWEYNTSSNIQTCEGYDYSFNIVANSSGGSNIIWWNKTGIAGEITRRYIQLNCTAVNISYIPYYFYETTFDSGDAGKHDRLHHDQGSGSLTDTGHLLNTVNSDTVQNRYCSVWVGFWFDNSTCVNSFTLDNIYYHVWWSSDVTQMEKIGWYKQRTSASSAFTDYFVAATSKSRSNISYDGATANDVYHLTANILDVTNTDVADNDIYEVIVKLYGGIEVSDNPSVISNRSFTSFVLLNVPDNATLNATHADTDSDGLSDWAELYVHYTNPFLADTDNDGVNDDVEISAGSDPNNYTDTAAAEFIWIDITNSSWALGNIVMGTSTYTNETGITFIADMDNTTVNTDLKLQITNDGVDWTAATSGNGAGVDTYRLNASIDIWAADENQIVTASVTTISTDITAGTNETFDLRFDAPTASTTGNEQTITTTATLVKH